MLFGGLRAAAYIALSCVGASFLVLLLVVWAGGGDRGTTPCGTAEEASSGLFATFGGWLSGLVSPGMGQSWACEMMDGLVAPTLRSAALIGVVLAFGALLAIAWVVAETLRGRQPGEAPVSLLQSLFLAPPALWASLITVSFNLALTGLFQLRPPAEPTDWYFPMAQTPLRYGAALLALTFGGGTFWQLRDGLRHDLDRLVRQDFMVVARANGLGTPARLVRNLAAPFANRLVSLVPFLLGEVIVVEFIFLLDGAGWELFKRVGMRDAPALMTLTLFFVLMTLCLRAAVRLADAWLTPALKEEAL